MCVRREREGGGEGEWGGEGGGGVYTHLCECIYHSLQVRYINLYHEGDVTPYGCVLTECRLNRCWSELMERCQFNERKANVEAFNRLVSTSLCVLCKYSN